MIGWPSRRLRLDAVKAEFGQIKLFDKDIDRPDRIIFAQIFVQPLGNSALWLRSSPTTKRAIHSSGQFAGES